MSSQETLTNCDSIGSLLWECKICNQFSLFGGSNGKTLFHYGCDQQAHETFAENSISATNLKCLICKRVSFTDKFSNVHTGCTHFRSVSETDIGVKEIRKDISSFHNICLNSIGASLDKLPNACV